MENNLALPVLFCLVKGKNTDVYLKLLGIVEELANEAGMAVFNRDVMLVCDFELSLINAVRERYESVEVKCCFFHFTKNLRDKARPVVNAIKNAAGEKSEKHQLAKGPRDA